MTTLKQMFLKRMIEGDMYGVDGYHRTGIQLMSRKVEVDTTVYGDAEPTVWLSLTDKDFGETVTVGYENPAHLKTLITALEAARFWLVAVRKVKNGCRSDEEWRSKRHHLQDLLPPLLEEENGS